MHAQRSRVSLPHDADRAGRGASGPLMPVLIALVAFAAGALMFFKPADSTAPREDSATATPVAPAKPARPALTADEERYIRALWPIHGDVQRSTLRMSLGQIFYSNKDLGAPELKARVEQALGVYKNAQTRMQELQPPESLRAQHDDYLAAVRLFEESAQRDHEDVRRWPRGAPPGGPPQGPGRRRQDSRDRRQVLAQRIRTALGDAVRREHAKTPTTKGDPMKRKLLLACAGMVVALGSLGIPQLLQANGRDHDDDRNDHGRPPQTLRQGFESTGQLLHDVRRAEQGPKHSAWIVESSRFINVPTRAFMPDVGTPATVDLPVNIGIIKSPDGQITLYDSGWKQLGYIFDWNTSCCWAAIRQQMRSHRPEPRPRDPDRRRPRALGSLRPTERVSQCRAVHPERGTEADRLLPRLSDRVQQRQDPRGQHGRPAHRRPVRSARSRRARAARRAAIRRRRCRRSSARSCRARRRSSMDGTSSRRAW